RATRASSPWPLPSRSRTSNSIFTARSRSSSGYFRCAAMTLHPPRFHGLQDSRGGPTIALRMDVTEFGRLYLPIQQRKLIHPYSDQADCAVTLEVVSLEEASLEHAGGLPARITPSRPFLPERQPWPRSPSP